MPHFTLRSRFSERVRKLGLITQAAVLSVAGAVPMLVAPSVNAQQLTSRRIAIGSSVVSETDVTYGVSFVTPSSPANQSTAALVIDFCSNSPIVGLACTAPTGFDINEAGLALANQVGVTDWQIDGATDTNTLILTRTGGAANVAASTTISLDLGSSGGSDGITNTSTLGTFYARILTYSVAATAQAYTPASPGSHLDDGGVAMSTANQLTVSARVQEILQFCVGTTDAATNNDCTDISGTNIDLGVLDSTTVTTTATDAGLAMVRTNASSGVTIGYFAEQAVTGTNHLGSLRVSGASCNVGSVETDQCINSQGTSQATFTAGVENFGMTANAVDVSNGSTSNLTRDAQYDGNAGGYAWDESGALDTIATSSTVVDDEMLPLQFAGAVDITTPTGQYSVTATFIATATF